MADLSAKPSLDHLRRQARDLMRAARAGDTTAAGRIRAVADALTLASAQLAVAREYGFASWTRLRDEVTARAASLARQAEAFCEASIRDGASRAAGMNSSLPNLDSRGPSWVRLWGCAGRPVLPSGAVPAFDREMGGSWPVTGLILAGPACSCRGSGRLAAGWGGSGQRPGVPGVADRRAAQHGTVAGGDDGLEVRDVACGGRAGAEGSGAGHGPVEDGVAPGVGAHLLAVDDDRQGMPVRGERYRVVA